VEILFIFALPNKQKLNTMTTIQLKNEKCSFEINFTTKEINGSDLRDVYNMPVCYNKTSRSIKKAAIALQNEWNEYLSMYEVMDILFKNGIKMRSYCSMD